MKHLPALDLEAAASTHIHHPGPLPRCPQQHKRSCAQLPKLTLQDNAHKREAQDAVVARSG
jgi:hypothetical protein